MSIILAAGDVIRIRVGCYQDNQAAYNIRYGSVSNVAGQGINLDALATAIDALVAPLYKLVLSTNAEYIGVGAAIRAVAAADNSVEFADTSNRGAGQVAGDPLPKMVCGIVTINSLQAGRAGRGRMYIPFAGETDNLATNKPQQSYQDGIANIGSEFIGTKTYGTAPDTIDFKWAVSSPTRGTVGPDATTRTARGKWATQRRRGDYGAANEVPFDG